MSVAARPPLFTTADRWRTGALVAAGAVTIALSWFLAAGRADAGDQLICVSLSLVGALALSLTLVPLLCSVLLRKNLPEEDTGSYNTLGGFVMLQLGRVPQIADKFDWGGLRFEVVDMDRNRVDKLLVARLPESESATMR